MEVLSFFVKYGICCLEGNVRVAGDEVFGMRMKN